MRKILAVAVAAAFLAPSSGVAMAGQRLAFHAGGGAHFGGMRGFGAHGFGARGFGMRGFGERYAYGHQARYRRWDGYRWNYSGGDYGYAAPDPAAALFGAALGFVAGQY